MTALESLKQLLLQHVDVAGAETPLGGLAVFHCRQLQQLHQVPIHQSSVVLVIEGQKDWVRTADTLVALPGDILLLPAGSEIAFINRPSVSKGEYLALVASFDGANLAEFRQSYRGDFDWPTLGRETYAHSPVALVQAFLQWTQWCLQHPVIDPLLQRHRQHEFLLILLGAGLGGHLFQYGDLPWRQRVASLLAADPGRPWRLSDISRQLCCSESSLRRHLVGENTGFRQILDEIRLVTGLAMLQETSWPVALVAHNVGYQSPSRFTERFRQRFGMSPSELRCSRVAAEG